MHARAAEEEPRGDGLVETGAPRPSRAPRAPSKKSPLSIEEVTRGMIVRTLSVPPHEVVFVKGIIEANNGVAGLFAVSGGELSLAAPLDRADDLRELVSDLAAAIDANRTHAK